MAIDGRTLRRERTRARVLDAARRLIESSGAAHVTMEGIAAEAKVSRRATYDHFGSRAGLLLALVDEVDRDAQLDRRMAPVFDAPTAVEGIRRLVAVIAQVTPQLFDLAIAFERARRVDPDVDTAWEDRMQGRIKTCLRIASRLNEERRLRPGIGVDAAADLIYAAISWQQWQLLVVERGWSPRKWRKRTIDLLEHTLVRPETENSPPPSTTDG